MRYFFLVIMFAVAFASGYAPEARAYETDQYTNRLEMLQNLRDSRDAMNAIMNQKIQYAIDHWDEKWGRDPALFAKKVRGVPFPVNLWVGPEIESETERAIDRRLPSPHNIYSDSTVKGFKLGWAVHILPNVEGRKRINWIIRIASTIKLAGVLLGTDKIGHFISEGYDAYVAGVVKGRGDQGAMNWAYNAENSYEGYGLFGVFSNGDLTANAEGYLFYRSLSEDGIVNGKPAIVRWVGNKPEMQRPFDWADHVNDFWDEALNPCLYDKGLQRTVHAKLQAMCGDYEKVPMAYVPRDETALKVRYSWLRYRPNLNDRMDHVCAPAP